MLPTKPDEQNSGQQYRSCGWRREHSPLIDDQAVYLLMTMPGKYQFIRSRQFLRAGAHSQFGLEAGKVALTGLTYCIWTNKLAGDGRKRTRPDSAIA
jgi:hypothetical protein